MASDMTRKLAVWSQPVEAIGLAPRFLPLLKVASNFPLKRLDKFPSLTIGGEPKGGNLCFAAQLNGGSPCFETGLRRAH